MNITIDTSALIAVIINEPEKKKIIEITTGCRLIFCPNSVHWEIGNAFSAMLKRKRITLEQVKIAIDEFRKIPIQFIDVNLNSTMELVNNFHIYAYDAYLITCALQSNTPLLTLDKKLIDVAKSAGVEVLEVN
jgi:predicted nucleic acid-binding protein